MTTELIKASRVAGRDMSLSALSKSKSGAIGDSTTDIHSWLRVCGIAFGLSVRRKGSRNLRHRH